MDYYAPQWMDLARTPQSPSDDYFDREHEVHRPRMYKFADSDSSLDEHGEDPLSTPSTGKYVKENSGRIKDSPFWVISQNTAKNIVKKPTTYDNVLREAMKNLELAGKIRKTPKVLNSSHVAVSNSLKVIPASKKRPKSMGFHAIDNNVQSVSSEKPDKIKQDACKEKNDNTNNGVEESDDPVPIVQAHSDVPLSNVITNKVFVEEKLPRKHVPKVLVYQNRRRSSINRRRSLINHRRRSNKYMSLAEAVSKFHTETPKRFRTLSNKESKIGPVAKVKQAIKPTIPISPALLSKNRTRTIVTTDQKKDVEAEETKKCSIKVTQNNISKGSAKKVMKPTASETPDLTTSRRKYYSFSEASQGVHSSKKRMATTIVTADLTGITVQNEEITFFGVPVKTNSKSSTRIMPFSFETRDKESQIKKEQKLKDLQNQDSNKIKSGFQAKSAPNLLKSAAQTKKPGQIKKAVVPCPFSFEARDKTLAKKKEELIKQTLEEEKKHRIFHATPVPSFKPVVVRGVSKENVKTKTGNHDQENKEPNIMKTRSCLIPNVDQNEKIQQNKPKEEKHLEIKNCTDNKDASTLKMSQKKDIKGSNLELNTDKRAKQRKEFEEKLRQKEIEEERKRQEEEKKKLEKQKMENAQLRKQTEVKARPMPLHKPHILLKSSKALTNPQSPAWAHKTKSRNIP